jgi:hypothetical protein
LSYCRQLNNYIYEITLLHRLNGRIWNADRLSISNREMTYIIAVSNQSATLLAIAPIVGIASIDSANGINVNFDYDKEKYKEMILDAAETVLGYFGFDRSVYGNRKNISLRKWRWFEELRQERERDINLEMSENPTPS